MVFWKNLFGVLKVGFKEVKGLNTEKQEHLKVVLTTNFSPRRAGEAARLPIDELAAGMSRFWELLQLCKPGVVIVLTEKVREMALIYSKIKDLGQRITDDAHHVEIGGKSYTPRSCWLNVEGRVNFFLRLCPNIQPELMRAGAPMSPLSVHTWDAAFETH